MVESVRTTDGRHMHLAGVVERPLSRSRETGGRALLVCCVQSVVCGKILAEGFSLQEGE